MLYGLLYRREARPPSRAEAQFYLRTAFNDDVDLDRSLAELSAHFVVTGTRDGQEIRYRLVGWIAHPQPVDDPPISDRLLAEVLAPQRCAQCGRTPLKHGVELEVDYRLPPNWGGTADPDNLQPLCLRCKRGKQQYMQVHAAHADKIRHAASYDEPQRRIGELLKAFKGEWVRTDLLSMVASAKEYQEDWQRRLRDLRYLGWKIKPQKRYHEGVRVWTYYRLVQSQPWPANIHATIRAEERRRRQAR
ncbi:MAG: HNH endonuclease signature motif containing protein, partial [Gammaproteobacteria bacterium]